MNVRVTLARTMVHVWIESVSLSAIVLLALLDWSVRLVSIYIYEDKNIDTPFPLPESFLSFDTKTHI